MILEFAKKFFTLYCDNRIAEMSEIESEYKTLIARKKELNEQGWLKIYNKLKPSYGYVKNRHLMDNLIQEVRTFLSTKTEGGDQRFQECKVS